MTTEQNDAHQVELEVTITARRSDNTYESGYWKLGAKRTFTGKLTSDGMLPALNKLTESVRKDTANQLALRFPTEPTPDPEEIN